jgi:uncharacterized protein YgiM (DUF1202 family)
MLFAAALLTALAAFPPETLQDPGLGEKKVTMKEAWFLKGPSRLSGTLRKAEDGEDVTVLSVDGKYSKVTVKKDSLEAYILSSALIAPEKFSRSASDEKEGQKLAAQGLEGQKGLNPETEKEFKSAGGASREQAYVDLDALMARPSYKSDRAALEAKLKDFRQEGKLGEFSPVK